MSQHNEKALRDKLVREEAKLSELDAKRDHTRQRIEALRSELEVEKNFQQPSSSIFQESNISITSSEKVKLFQKLIQGRTDLFPKRWVNSRKNTAGYSAACANEWVRGVCDKPKVKCGNCQNQAFLPVNDQVVLDHLTRALRGRRVPITQRRNLLVYCCRF